MAARDWRGVSLRYLRILVRLQNSHSVQQLRCWAPEVHRSLWPCRKMRPLARCSPSLSKVCRWGRTLSRASYTWSNPTAAIPHTFQLQQKFLPTDLPFCACDVVDMRKMTGVPPYHDSSFHFLSFPRMFEGSWNVQGRPNLWPLRRWRWNTEGVELSCRKFKLRLLAGHSCYKSILGLQVGSSIDLESFCLQLFSFLGQRLHGLKCHQQCFK